MSSNFVIQLLEWAAIFFFVVVTLSWFLAIKLNFFSLIDPVWALGIGLGAVIVQLNSLHFERSLLTITLALLWSLRLGIYLALRLKNHYPNEDTRYVTLRKAWGNKLYLKSFLFFVFQGASQVFFVLPFALQALDGSLFPRTSEIIGGVLFFVGLLGEGLADLQLRGFKDNPQNKGKVCDVGLWRYSRHPNYFFEWIIWCGFGLLPWGAPYGYFSLLCPTAMLFLLLFVTGVGPSEEQSLKSRGQAYVDYQKRTSRFVPWPRKIPKTA